MQPTSKAGARLMTFGPCIEQEENTAEPLQEVKRKISNIRWSSANPIFAAQNHDGVASFGFGERTSSFRRSGTLTTFRERAAIMKNSIFSIVQYMNPFQLHEETFSPSFSSPERSTSVRSSIFGIISALLGGELLSLPYAFSQV